MRGILWCAAAAAVIGLVSTSMGVADPGDPRPISLELTFPAGKSPRVFTAGWVFGAHCLIAPGSAQEVDISGEVAWGGSGTFRPREGSLSRPVFKAAGENTITLTVTVDGKKRSKTWTVIAVDPTAEPRYARVSDIAKCPSDVHGCKACPHPVQGPILTGSPNVTIGGLPAARKGDTGVHAACCGPNTFEIVEGDPTLLIDGRPAARVGHKTRHCGGVGKIDGRGQGYYAVFGTTVPEMKEDRQPKLPDDASLEDTIAAYERLGVEDFEFKLPKPDANPMVLRIEGLALGKYPELEKGARYALGVKGTLQEENQKISMSGALLLTLRGTYESVEALKKAEKKVTDTLLGTPGVLYTAEGKGVLVDKGEVIELGPLTKGWTAEAKQQAVDLVVDLMPFFDCFIAHAVYADPVGSEVDAFRRFRETVLRRTPQGRRLIRLYNEYGPGYAMEVRRSSTLKTLARHYLDRIAAWVETLDLEDPQTLRELDGLVMLADAAVSSVWKEGAGPGIGRLARIFAELGLR